MTKCRHVNQNGNYCAKCGEKLREKCPECGEWETINRPVCVKKINEAKGVYDIYVFSKSPWKFAYWLLFAGLPLIILFIPSIFYPGTYFKPLCRWFDLPPLECIFTSRFIPFGMILFSGVILENPLDRWIFNKRKLEFPEKFPVEAEILRKAEGGR